MADRTIIAFQVQAPLFNDIVGVLNQLPASASRALLNRIEGGQVTPIFEGGDLGGHRVRDPDPTDPPPPPTRRNGQGRAKTAKRRVARRKGGK